MKTFIMLSMLWILTACGKVRHTEIREVCSSDSPGFVLPDRIVCDHSPSQEVMVEGGGVVYICTKLAADPQ